MHAVQTILLLFIVAGVAYIAYQLFRRGPEGMHFAGPAAEGQQQAVHAGTGGTDRYDRQLAVYREVVRVLTRIAQDGHVEKAELLEYRSRTHEAGFLFDEGLAGYIEEIYRRALMLAGTNIALKKAALPIGDERDAITVENSKQLIWLADQLPQLKLRFEKYLTGAAPTVS